MTTINATTVLWKAKAAKRWRRTILLEGSSNMPAGGYLERVMIVHLKGKRGFDLPFSVERRECKHEEWRAQKAAIYHEFDKDWTIEAEASENVCSEAELRKVIGRKGLIKTGADTLDYLASWYPIEIDKNIFRSHDGMETTRIVFAENRAGRSFVLKATKRAGRPETSDLQLFSSGGFPAFQKLGNEFRYNTPSFRLEAPPRVKAVDEPGFTAALGAHALSLLSLDDYAHLVRGGIRPIAAHSEDWLDGFDHGGAGLPAPPIAKAPAPLPSTSATSPLPPTPISVSKPHAPPLPKIDHAAERAREVDALTDDPEFGAF